MLLCERKGRLFYERRGNQLFELNREKGLWYIKKGGGVPLNSANSNPAEMIFGPLSIADSSLGKGRKDSNRAGLEQGNGNSATGVISGRLLHLCAAETGDGKIGRERIKIRRTIKFNR